MELGNKCTIVDYGNELGDIKITGDVQPLDGSRDVDVFVNPQVAFNTSVDTEFGMLNMSDEYNVYRVKLDEFHLKTSNNQIITGDIEWNADRDVALLKTLNIMPSQQNMEVAVKVHIEKKTNAGWEQLTVGGQPDFEKAQVKFVSGEEPKTIPESNIRYSYPVKAQYNFHKDEYNKGYIRLNSGQPNLFRSSIDGLQWKYAAKFETPAGQMVESPLTYDESNATLHFDIPSTLKNASAYDMSILRKPLTENTAIDHNVQREDIALQTPNAGDSLSIAQSSLTGSIRTDSEAVLHSYSFRTSIYPTFNDRLDAMSGYQYRFGVDTSIMIQRLGAKFHLQEAFDDCERNGRGNSKALIYAEGSLSNEWSKGHIYPMVYELYGSDPGMALVRNNNLDVIPLKAMQVTNMNMIDYSFQGDQTSNISGDVEIYYNLPPQMYLDFSKLRNQAIAKYAGTSIPAPPQARRLIDGNFHNIYRDTYRYTLNYRLPGIDKITTSREFTIVH